MAKIIGKRMVVFSIAAGAFYGISIRLLLKFYRPLHPFVDVMSIGFVLLVPFAMGFVTMWIAERQQRQSILSWILLPWVPLLISLAGMLVTLLEGMICIVMLLPIGVLLATLGGVCAGLIVRYTPSLRSHNLPVVIVIVLPMLVGSLEPQYLKRNDVRAIETTVDIHATPAVVWRNIERVRAIRPAELRSSWTSRIGFPAPVEATLSFEGVGAVRHASFAGGVLFLETVDIWEPERKLSFSIHADQVPNKTLDEHVQVGGEYFDVLRGEYRLEPLPDGVTRLHLASQHRLSTDFNWYAHLWTDGIMGDIQKNILRVIQERCEREPNGRQP